MKRWFDYANYQLWLFVVGGAVLAAYRAFAPLPVDRPPPEVFELAVKLDPGYAQGWFNLGIYAQKGDRLAEALADYRKAAEADPADHTVCATRGQVAARLKAWDEARTALECAVRYDPDDWSSHDELAGVLVAQGQLKQAAAEMEAALRLNPNENRIRIDLGGVMAQLGDDVKAEQLLYEAVRINPTAPRPVFDLGLIALRRKDTAEARRRFEQTVLIDPSYVPALGNLATLELDSGQVQLARSHLEALLRVSPGDARAQALLGQLPP